MDAKEAEVKRFAKKLEGLVQDNKTLGYKI